MKKIKQFIKKLIMWTLAVAVVGGSAYGAYWYHTQDSTVAYQAPTVEAVEVVADDVTEAARMLAEATAKLTAEEEKLLTEKKAIEAEAAAKVAEIEKRIEEINHIRSSF